MYYFIFFKKKYTTDVLNFLYLVAAEHVILGIKFLIESVIPDSPDWVKTILILYKKLKQILRLKVH